MGEIQLIGYSSDDLETSKLHPIKNGALWHKYDVRGEIRYYRNKLKLIDPMIFWYMGKVPKPIFSHWDVGYAATLKEDVRLNRMKTVIVSDDMLPPSQEVLSPSTKNDEYFCYSVRGEKQYYKVYKKWDAAVVKEYDIKFLGVCRLPTKEINKYHAKSGNGKIKTTTSVKRPSVYYRPTNTHCCYCGVLLTAPDNILPTAKTRDHIVPLVKGGTNDPKNLKNCCLACNGEKGSMLLSTYIQYLCFQQSQVFINSGEYELLQTKIINANEIAKEMDK